MSHYEIIRPRQQTRLQRWAEGLRSFTLGPFNPKDREIARIFGGSPSHAGVSVNEDTAMTISAVWSAVTMISDDVASLPLMLYKRLPSGGKDRFEEHPLYRLLHDSPNPEMDSMVFRRTMQAHALLWQNAYAEIERDSIGRPAALWPLVPERVDLIRDNGRLTYRVRNDSGRQVFLDPEDMIHLVGYSHDGSVGCSLVRQARESLGLALATERYGASFFGNGASMGGVVSVKGPRPDPKVEKGHRDQLEARHQGLERAHKMLILYNDADYKSNVIPPNAGQFNETRVLQIREIARWFKVPPHKLGDLADATYSNVEQMDAAYLSSCIRPWLVLWQQQLSRKLIAKLERRQQFIEHETHGFLSVDAQSRAELYSAESNIGSIQINEVRGYENRDPIAGGDESFVQQNVIPLSRVSQWWDLLIDEKKATIEKLKEPPAPVAPPQPAGPTPQEMKTLEEALTATRQALQQAEDSRDVAVAEAEKSEKFIAALKQEIVDAGLLLTETKTTLEAEFKLASDLAHSRGEEIEALTTRNTAAHAELEALDERIKTNTAEWAAWKEQIERELQIAKDFGWKHEQDKDAALSLASEAEKARVEALAKVEESEARAQKAESDRAAESLANGEALALLQGFRSQAESDRDAVLALVSEGEKARDAAIAQFEDMEAQRDAAKIRAGEAENDKGVALLRIETLTRLHEVATAEAETLKTDLARARADIATELERQQTQRSSLFGAVRHVVADAMGRMVRREVAKAKNFRTNPQKLGAWIDAYYDKTEEDLFVEALLPATRLHATLIESRDDPAELARGLVREHFAESMQTLTGILDAGPDGFGEMVDRTLHRWESTRADKLADRIMEEEIRNVR